MMVFLGSVIAVSSAAVIFFPRGADEGAELLAAPGGWFHTQPRSLELSRVTVDRVIDGDTFDVFVTGEVQHVRLFGIDAPEAGQPCSAEATARLEALVASEVLLLADDRLEDDRGRPVRYVFTLGGLSIDAALIAEGLAEAWRSDGAYRDQLVRIEDAARDAQDGCLWSGR